MSTAILANGDFPRHPAALAALRGAERVVCCDGAAAQALLHGIRPAAVAGDLDSLPGCLRERFSALLVHSAEQETNDLSKAFRLCLAHGWRDLVFLGATGGREDHTLGNLSHFVDFAREAPGAPLVTDTGVFRVVLPPGGTIPTKPGQQISLIAPDPSTRLSATGLVYPVQALRLQRWWEGTLNEATADTVEITTDAPLLVFSAHADAGAKHRLPAHDSSPLPVALTVAGSDSGGNAGIQADLRAFHALGVHGCCAITSLTAQNPLGVRSAQAADPALVADQLDAIFEGYHVGGAKTGMLPSAEIVEVVAEKFSAHPEIPLVVAPVMVATSGARLVGDDAVSAIRDSLLPLAALATPNLPEAEVLLGEPFTDTATAARYLADRLGCAVLLKGGHSAERPAEDFFAQKDGTVLRITTNAIQNPLSTHGTGCTLSAAIAGALARGLPLPDAVLAGKALVFEAIRTGRPVPPSAVLGLPSSLPLAEVLVASCQF